MIYVKRNNLDISESDITVTSEKFGFSRLTSSLVLSRGFDSRETENLLNDNTSIFPQHNEIPNIEIAAQRIEEAIMSGEKIAVFGDYDADGICGTSILINAFKSVGYDNATYYIPNRISEGYGLNNFAIDQIKEQGCTLIVTVDCGISNIEEAEYVNKNGIDLIITDHHLPGDVLPEAIVVNPKLSDNEMLHQLCGAAVALRLMCVLFDDEVYYDNCDLAAIATIADMVELEGENRYIVKTGLSKINMRDDENIAVLADECLKDRKIIKSDDISFSIAPAINAAGRLDQADKCVELFTGSAEDPHETAAILAHDNFNRRKIEKETFYSALSRIKDIDFSKEKAIILYDESWHQGVLGIAASKIKNIYFRPVILFTQNEGELVGSARSVEGLNIHEAITYCSDYVSHFGGHFMAAGLSLSPENFDGFKSEFEEYLKNVEKDIFLPKMGYDIEASPTDINMALLNELERLEPFGKGNPAPVFLLSGVKIAGYEKIGADKTHFRCKIKSESTSLAAVAFSNGTQLDEKFVYDAVVSPQINRWNGRSSVQLMVQDIKPSFSNGVWSEFLESLAPSFELSLSQAYYSGESAASNESDYERMKAVLDENIFSVLLLAMDKESADGIKNALGEKFEQLDIRNGCIEKDKVNYNTLVLAPDIEKLVFAEYKHVFLVSKYNTLKMYKSLQVNGNVYIISEYKTLDEKRYEISLDRLRELYIIFKKAVLEKAFSEILSEEGLWEKRAALRIFKEAGLMEYDLVKEEVALTDIKKTDIEKSGTYKNMRTGG